MDDELIPLAGRVCRAIEVLHSMVYFAPEPEELYVAAGLRPGRMGYFASRAAAMGPVSPAVVTATFYNFNGELVGRHIPRAWTLATPEAILVARYAGVDAALRRLLGSQVEGPEVAEASSLVRAAASDLPVEGRPLFAAHAALPWPDEPHLVLWHGATLLREFRGDGHIAALLDAELSGIEAIVTHVATGRGFTVESAKVLRFWSDEQWSDAQKSLQDKGILSSAGELTEAGTAQRESIEHRTDVLTLPAMRPLGVEGAQRLTELGRGLSRVIIGNGALPAGVFSSRS